MNGHALAVRKNSSSVMPERPRQIDRPHIMKRHAGKKITQWQPFELLCRDLGHGAVFVAFALAVFRFVPNSAQNGGSR